MIIKKFKKGRGDEPGVVQVKLRNLADGGVVLEVVNADGKRMCQGSVLMMHKDGIQLVGSFGEDFGIRLDTLRDKINLK
jgi:translation elongation factor P/translation initiation factor 5A